MLLIIFFHFLIQKFHGEFILVSTLIEQIFVKFIN
jgi:hypothetical protein